MIHSGTSRTVRPDSRCLQSPPHSTKHSTSSISSSKQNYSKQIHYLFGLLKKKKTLTSVLFTAVPLSSSEDPGRREGQGLRLLGLGPSPWVRWGQQTEPVLLVFCGFFVGFLLFFLGVSRFFFVFCWFFVGFCWFLLVFLGFSWFFLVFLGFCWFFLVFLVFSWFFLFFLGFSWFFLLFLGVCNMPRHPKESF